jgi:hypothetical protein
MAKPIIIGKDDGRYNRGNCARMGFRSAVVRRWKRGGRLMSLAARTGHIVEKVDERCGISLPGARRASAIWCGPARLRRGICSSPAPEQAIAQSARRRQQRRGPSGVNRWGLVTYREGDSNPHALRRSILSRVRLPFRHPGDCSFSIYPRGPFASRLASTPAEYRGTRTRPIAAPGGL